VDGDREQLVGANESLARQVNEAIERGQWPDEHDQRSAYRCDCARLDCNRLVELTPAEYEQVRVHPRRFLVFPGHERPEVETVIEATADNTLALSASPNLGCRSRLRPRAMTASEQ
jgi:hypothetical protein